MNIINRNISFKIDTGADCTVISADQYAKIKGELPLEKSNIRLNSLGGNLACEGTFCVKVNTYNDQKFQWLKIYIVCEDTVGQNGYQSAMEHASYRTCFIQIRRRSARSETRRCPTGWGCCRSWCNR